MATPAELQEQLRAALEEASFSFRALSGKQMDFAVQEIDRTRQQLTDLLAKYAGKDGEIKRERIAAIMKDLDVIEARIRENGMDSVESIIKETAKVVADDRKGMLESILGEGGSVGIAFNSLPENVFRYVATRFAADGLVLSDRVWQLSGQLRDELGATVRTGILQGQSLNTMIAAVRRVYDNDTWKIRRMVLTESAIAYRTADSYVAQQSKWVKALKIHRGKADRPEHMCSILERTDKYGMGAGIFIATDPSIQNPHVNCTSWLEYVLDADKIKKSEMAEAQSPPIPESPANPVDLLKEMTEKKDFEDWMKKHLGVTNPKMTDFHPEVMREMSKTLYDLKRRFPEAAERNLHTLGTLQYNKTIKYESMIDSFINGNKDIKHWADITKEHGEDEMRARFREYIVKNNLVKREEVEKGMVAMGAEYTGKNKMNSGIFINASLTKDHEKYTKVMKHLGDIDYVTVDTIAGAVAHEYGHLVHYHLESEFRTKFIDDLWATWRNQDMETFWKPHVSQYASYSIEETFAELFAEYVMKPDTARPAAKHFGEQLEKTLSLMRRSKEK